MARSGSPALDRMTDAFFAVDDDWRFTYLNERGRDVVCEAMGREATVEELEGADIWEEIPEAVDTEFYDRYHEAMATQEPVSFEAYYDPIDTWFEVRAYPDESGLSVYFRDVTERKEREAALQEHEAVLKEVYRVTADKSASLEEKVDSLLSIGQSVLGTEYGALSRVDGDDYVFEVVHDPDGATEAGDVVPLGETNCERAIVTEETLVLEDIAADAPELTDRAGFTDQGVACYLGTPVVVDDEVYGTFCFYDREPRSEPFSEWEATLVELMGNWVSYEQERVRRETELRRERDRLDGFAAVVSHDLRNPLGIAAGRLELAREECDCEDLAAAEEALDRMDGIIEDVLTVARDDREAVDPEPLSLAELVRAAWEAVDGGDAALAVEGDATVVADERRVRRLFENLLGNAVDHGGDGVTVTVGPLDRGFYVADDGPGIPESEREAVFEPGHSTSDDGTGFGLHIVQSVAADHGWEVAVTDADGGGARFEVTGVDIR